MESTLREPFMSRLVLTSAHLTSCCRHSRSFIPKTWDECQWQWRTSHWPHSIKLLREDICYVSVEGLVLLQARLEPLDVTGLKIPL